MIRISDLDFSYGDKVVFESFSLDVPSPVAVVTGPSGGGKTTLLRLIAGLEKPGRGTIDNVPGRVAFMFQEDRLLPWLTAAQNVAAVLPRSRRHTAGTYLEMVELSAEAGTKPGELSGGQRRRIALARALAYGGDLLVLDEPLKGLDPGLTERIVPKILTFGADIIVTSHSDFETKLWGGGIVTVGG